MIFTEDQITEIKALAKKEPMAKKLWEYYLNSQADGVKAIRNTLNSELLALNKSLHKKDIDFEFTLNRIGEISTVLKKNKSIFDFEADQKRK